MAKLFTEKPVLLCQGFLPIFGAVPGTTSGLVQFNIKTDRGKVNRIDMMPVFDIPTAGTGLNATVNVSAGGQQILKNAEIPPYSFLLQLGSMQDHLTRVNLNEAQTLNAELDNTLGFIPSFAQLQCFYTTPEHEEFLRNFKWKNGLGVKRQTFKLNIPAGAPPPGGFRILEISDTIPRMFGNVIGLSVCQNISAAESVNMFHSVEINGVTALEDVIGLNADPQCGRQQYIYRVGIQPGSTFRFLVKDFGGTIAPINFNNYFLTFYFDN